MRKKIILGLGTLLLGGLFWYLFVKPNDYRVTFTSKGIPGTLNQEIKLWANSIGNSKFVEQKNLNNFVHHFNFNDSIHHYDWSILKLNDSMSRIKILVKDIDHSLWNKLCIPFFETDFEKRTKKTIKDCMITIKEHTDNFKVTILGESEIAPKYYAYVSLKSSQKGKALKMMENYSFLNSILVKNGLSLDGQPFIEIKEWFIQSDSISYNFCYPIIKPDTLPEIIGIKFNSLKSQKAIKAIYNGNYITSDRAWYHLLEYAQKKNLLVEEKPIEIFFTNPNMGGDELSWKSEVFMPLKQVTN